ncbi:MAG: hypothetical protein PHV20_11605, partial [Bacteroidales bacterium]|nr:hypothetical protein [Bacteroidales bacterium]
SFVQIKQKSNFKTPENLISENILISCQKKRLNSNFILRQPLFVLIFSLRYEIALCKMAFLIGLKINFTQPNIYEKLINPQIINP